MHVYRKDAIEPTQSTAECRNNHARWVRDIDFSPTPKTSFVNWLWLGITAFREKMMSALLEFHSGILTSYIKSEIQQGHSLHSFCFLKKKLCIEKPHCMRLVNSKKTVKKFLQNPDFCTIGQNFKNNWPNSKLYIWKVYVCRFDPAMFVLVEWNDYQITGMEKLQWKILFSEESKQEK